jgi:uncharacterized protein YecT (DUF1311 family)
MKKTIITLMMLTPPIDAIASDCLQKAVTQYDMNICSKSEADKSDAELNRVYNKVLNLMKNDPIATQKTRQAEQAWIKYRDAQLAMYYPPRAAGWYGSFQPVCDNTTYQKLTDDRIKQLKEYLAQPEEGDMCARTLYGNESYAKKVKT